MILRARSLPIRPIKPRFPMVIPMVKVDYIAAPLITQMQIIGKLGDMANSRIKKRKYIR